MYFQRVLELAFLFCRVLVCYGLMVAFLAAPPVISLNQRLTDGLQGWIRSDALLVPRSIPESARVYSTQEAVEIIWLGKSAKDSFTQNEQGHLQDVHHLIAWGSFIVGCAVIISILIEKEVVPQRLVVDVRRMILTLVLLTLLAVTGFSFFFELFHQVFFPQGNYSFPADSLIIQCFPPLFWMLNLIWLQLGVLVLLRWQAHHAEKLSI